MARLTAHGKYLLDGADKFYLRGVSYGPFAPNSRGERYPEPERAAADFALMKRLGANVIRLYVPPPPWMVEAAQKAGLRMMLGIPWPFHMAFLDSADMMREIRDAIRKTVLDTRQFGETIAAYSIGNEIRSDIVRWHGPRAVSKFLAELRDLGKQIDPAALFTYSNYPSAEYLDLSFLDFVSFNVYLHREEDFRRYLTHLMGQCGELPLVLSETGMDTIREGEQHQADLLSWQCRAAFELGLSGFIVFAFTDEWHTGGAEITDWAFGLTRRDRSPKLAFDAVGKVFSDNLPPPLTSAPKATVVVAAYNAAATLGECLSSLRNLNYPDYETIVVDDGSTDSTAEIAGDDGNGVRTIRVEHNGLAAARNAGIDAASGEIVAFIDADARADRDWLYHLIETIKRRDAAAASGPNFAPDSQIIPRRRDGGRARIAARSARRRRSPRATLRMQHGDHKSSPAKGWRFRSDVHRRRRRRRSLVAPRRVERNARVRSWSRRDPRAPRDSLCLSPPAARLRRRRRPALPQISPAHRRPGRNLRDAVMARLALQRCPRLLRRVRPRPLPDRLLRRQLVRRPATDHPMDRRVADSSDPRRRQSRSRRTRRMRTGHLDTDRSGERSIRPHRRASTPVQSHEPGSPSSTCSAPQFAASRASASNGDSIPPAGIDHNGPLNFSGQVEFVIPDAATVDSATILAALRDALIRRGVAVAETDGFQAYDLELVVPPMIRVPINALRRNDRSIAILFRIRTTPRRALVAAAIIFALLAATSSIGAGVVGVIFAALAVGVLAINRASRIPAIIKACAADVAAALGISVAEVEDKIS